MAPLTPRTLSVQALLDARSDVLELEVLTEGVSLEAVTDDADVTSPGLALAGHTARVPGGRMWVFGETEMTYLASIDEADARQRLAALFAYGVPAAFVTKKQVVPRYFLEVATEMGVPILRSAKSTKEFYQRLKPYLEEALAPTTTLHGSLADVYGIGVLFVGDSGVGKSECVLDLVERGHRLVADDLVLVTKRGNELLIGHGHELQKHHMEIRGVGIIDVQALFGVRSIRQQKRIEVIVHLEIWDQERSYSRTGLEREHEEILGVSIPKVTVPLNPGKNITVIAEVVAMSQLLRYTGVESAENFDRRLRQYLEQDYE
ncbi:MAG: HPr(Ser) kinase/phosphatase [Gemmatimonadota bacterium]|nr:HPr(Ser) kinase/phosphatase [Gemmatimonadota bacterium]MDH3422457.1 HPr(Ser) kinase/phosphatase [Gemmatimonadota bacterium]